MLNWGRGLVVGWAGSMWLDWGLDREVIWGLDRELTFLRVDSKCSEITTQEASMKFDK